MGRRAFGPRDDEATGTETGDARRHGLRAEAALGQRELLRCLGGTADGELGPADLPGLLRRRAIGPRDDDAVAAGRDARRADLPETGDAREAALGREDGITLRDADVDRVAAPER